MELILLMGPITAMHHCLMAQTVVVMLEDVEVRILIIGEFKKGELFNCSVAAQSVVAIQIYSLCSRWR